MVTKVNPRRYLPIMGIVVALVAILALPASAAGFVHGIVINVDGVDYYMAGAPDGPNGEFDVPGHEWVQTGPNRLVGKHYNAGPFEDSKWWSSDADDGELLYVVNAIIDTWSERKAERYASRGYVHYHQLITVADGTEHPEQVVWLKHTAWTTFTLDGGPATGKDIPMTQGVAYNFLPNWSKPYNP